LPACSRIATTPPPEDAPPATACFTDSSALLSSAYRALCVSPLGTSPAAPPELADAVGEWCVDGGALVKEGGTRRWHRATSALCATSTPTSAERSRSRQARAIGQVFVQVSTRRGSVASGLGAGWETRTSRGARGVQSAWRQPAARVYAHARACGAKDP
jgi:hypothetical protein